MAACGFTAWYTVGLAWGGGAVGGRARQWAPGIVSSNDPSVPVTDACEFSHVFGLLLTIPM
jgi:hypothetical protein